MRVSVVLAIRFAKFGQLIKSVNALFHDHKFTQSSRIHQQKTQATRKDEFDKRYSLWPDKNTKSRCVFASCSCHVLALTIILWLENDDPISTFNNMAYDPQKNVPIFIVPFAKRSLWKKSSNSDMCQSPVSLFHHPPNAPVIFAMATKHRMRTSNTDGISRERFVDWTASLSGSH